MKKTIGIVGLGLMGGSLAKAIKANTEDVVYAFDLNENSLIKATSEKVIDGVLTSQKLNQCDMVIICLYPKDTITYVKENILNFKKDSVITDCAGVKIKICDELSKLCQEHDLYFIGAHPMAGIEKSGYEFSYARMFDGASMIVCKHNLSDKNALQIVDEYYTNLGFGKITYTSPEEHDRIIAFTSQLAHIVSNAYVRSPQAKTHMGFSAGSYRDLTRVAYLNEYMWTELFLENKAPLVSEIRELAQRLNQYADYIDNDDSENLIKILLEGKKVKEAVG